MREATSKRALYVNPNTGMFSSLATGADFCAEHEGESENILKFFGAKCAPSFKTLLASDYESEDFISDISDFLVTNKDAMLLVKVPIAVPKDIVNAKYSVSIKKEVEEAKAALKKLKATFRLPTDATVMGTFLVSAQLLNPQQYHIRSHVEYAQRDKEVKMTCQEYIEAFNSNLTDGVLTVNSPEMATIVLSAMDLPRHQLDAIRDMLFLQHTEKHGLALPNLANRIYDYVASYEEELYSAKNGFIKTRLLSNWSSPWNKGQPVDIVFGSFDTRVGNTLAQAHDMLRAGKLLVGRHTTAFKGGSGIVLQSVDDIDEESRTTYAASYAEYRDTMMRFKASALFARLASKFQDVATLVKLSIGMIQTDSLFIRADSPSNRSEYITASYVPIEKLEDWLAGNISDVDMIAQHFQKNK